MNIKKFVEDRIKMNEDVLKDSYYYFRDRRKILGKLEAYNDVLKEIEKSKRRSRGLNVKSKIKK